MLKWFGFFVFSGSPILSITDVPADRAYTLKYPFSTMCTFFEVDFSQFFSFGVRIMLMAGSVTMIMLVIRQPTPLTFS